MKSVAERIAVCSWSLQPASAEDLIAKVQAVAIPRVQLHLNPLFEGGGGRHSEGSAEDWSGTFEKLAAAGIEVVSGMITTFGEDYTSHATIKETGGLVPDQHWACNEAMARQAAALAGANGIKLVSFHAGFIPHQAGPQRDELVRRMQVVAGFFQINGVDLILETGQEDAQSLADFLLAVGKTNVGVNFDPANMLLYGMGEPVAALRQLAPFLKQVHIKDATASPAPGAWGSEVVVGTGEVDWPAFMGVLDEAGYEGPLVIEREAGEDRQADIRAAQQHLVGLA